MRRLRIASVIGAVLFAGAVWWKAPSLNHRWLLLTATPAQAADLQPSHRYLSVLFIGQSNAANHGSARSSAPGPHRAWHEGQAKRLQDPLPGCSGVGGSVGVRLATTKPPTHDAWLVACAAQASTSIADWHPAGEPFRAAARAISEISKLGIGPHWIVIHQGETDAWLNTDAIKYEGELRALVARLIALAPMARILLCQTTIHSKGAPLHAELRAAQARVWVSLPQVWAGVDTDSFPERSRAWDGVHFNEKGLKVFASLLRRAIASPSDVPRRFGDEN